jgi:hypothetical protein
LISLRRELHTSDLAASIAMTLSHDPNASILVIVLSESSSDAIGRSLDEFERAGKIGAWSRRVQFVRFPPSPGEHVAFCETPLDTSLERGEDGSAMGMGLEKNPPSPCCKISARYRRPS